MATEAWFRNPLTYIRELAELVVPKITWDRGLLTKKGVDPFRHMGLHYPKGVEWRLLMVGEQGSAELGPNNDVDDPVAVYPTWEYGVDSVAQLEEWLASSVGQSSEFCSDVRVPPDERPVFGQEHRVVVTNLPPGTTGLGRRFLRDLRDLQAEYEEAILHVHGLYSYRLAFGGGYRAVDVEPRTTAGKGRVILPNGKELLWEKTTQVSQWISLLGYRTSDFSTPRNRCLYNIKSAIWAGEHYDENIKIKTRGEVEVDPNAVSVKPPEARRVQSSPAKAKPDDKFLCDTCSLQNTCKYFRSGAVCSIPDSEPASLAKFFKTRDSELIVEGLGTLLATQSRRLERGVEDEEEYGELNAEVTKILDSLFKNGERLAKLVNPNLRAQPRVAINVGTGPAAIGAPRPASLMGAFVAELEARGISRDQITPDLITALLTPDPPALDVAAVELPYDDDGPGDDPE